MIADQIAIAIDNALLYSEVKETISIRDQFVAMLTHDLRSPLTAVKAGVGLMRRYPDRVDLRERMLARIDQSVDRTDQMIQDLLDSTRIRAGQKIPLQLVECDLRLIAQDVCEELMLTYGDRFIINGPESLLGRWDQEGIRRVFENLFTNGAKYGLDHTPVTITLEANTNEVKVSVHNYGQPIPVDQQSRLFEPFERVIRSDSSIRLGWGLGLALVRGIVEAHGGKVEVHSEAGSGTTFVVSLPRGPRA